MDLAIIGLTLSGKTTLFNALTHGHAATGAFGAQEAHVGMVKVPDHRLDKLAALVHPKKITPTEIRFHDLAAAFGPAGSPRGEVAEALATADALIQVVRAFHRDDVPHPEGSVDPRRDLETMALELSLNDLAIIEKRLDKLDIAVRSARPGEREAGERELKLLSQAKELLEQDRPLRNHPFAPEEYKQLANYGLLTLKPMLILLNIDESAVGQAATLEDDYGARYAGPGTLVAATCARIEEEFAQLSDEEAAEFRQEMGFQESGVQRVLRLCHDLLGLVTFYTVVGDECRAWTVPQGTPAVKAAGKIHTDMEQGFIRAEVIPWDQLLDIGSLAEAKKQGLLRTEGKQYPVRDGDVLHILFHV